MKSLRYNDKPVLITEQTWPEDTVPLIATSTMSNNHAPYIRECIEGVWMQRITFPVKVVKINNPND